MSSLSPQLATSKGRVDRGLQSGLYQRTMSSRTSGYRDLYSERMALQYLTDAQANRNLSTLTSRSSNRFADSVHPPVIHNSPPPPETDPSVPIYPSMPPLPPLQQTANNRLQQCTELGVLTSEDRFPRPVNDTSADALGSGRPPTRGYALEQQGTCLVAPRAHRVLPPARTGEGSLGEAAKAAPSVERPLLLYTAEDERHLTDLHCFVRKRCVFLFAASQQDVDIPRKGRKKALTLGQVGIGCLHCKDSGEFHWLICGSEPKLIPFKSPSSRALHTFPRVSRASTTPQ